MLTQEIKGNLARLLATENLVVEHKSVSTASFNVDDRVLTLPNWEKASNVVYDLLVGHEVGHALYTPVWNKFSCPGDYVNVTEDARIEKLMKRRYPGLRKTFYCGYSELNAQDFFGIADEDLDTLLYIDRVNLHFKIGTAGVSVNFNPEEQALVDECAAAETFDEAVAVAEKMWELAKEQQKEMEQLANVPQSGGDGGSDESETQSTDAEEPEQQSEEGGEGSPDGEDDWEEENDEELPGTSGGEISESQTQEAFDRATQGLNNRYSGGRNTYVDIPKFNPDDFVVDWTTIHDWIDECSCEEYDYSFADAEYNSFKKSIQKEVNYLVKEFECRKSADSYARATTSRTGVLDCSKLHTYKYNEDLFRKVTTLAEGKNHGLVFVLDWSGSMGNVLQDTLKQLFNLMWFCKKASIPFEVYAFTNEYPKEPTEETLREDYTQHAYEKREGLIAVGPWFSMMNIFSSSVKTKELEQQMKNFYRLSYNMTRWSIAPIPTGLSLSGTPLNEAFISLHQILPQFKKQYKVQKVQCVVLTDGEAGGMKYHKEVQRRWEDGPFLGVGSVQANAFLRNRKTGNTYSFDCEWWEMSDIFLKNLRDTFADVSFIGIRVLESRDAGSFIRRYCGWGPKFEKIQKVWKKERAFALHDAGYHTYFGMSAAALSNNSEFDVDEGASKAKIKSAFVKSLKNKKMNKKVLGEFIELIA